MGKKPLQATSVEGQRPSIRKFQILALQPNPCECDLVLPYRREELFFAPHANENGMAVDQTGHKSRRRGYPRW